MEWKFQFRMLTFLIKTKLFDDLKTKVFSFTEVSWNTLFEIFTKTKCLPNTATYRNCFLAWLCLQEHSETQDSHRACFKLIRQNALRCHCLLGLQVFFGPSAEWKWGCWKGNLWKQCTLWKHSLKSVQNKSAFYPGGKKGICEEHFRTGLVCMALWGEEEQEGYLMQIHDYTISLLL